MSKSASDDDQPGLWPVTAPEKSALPEVSRPKGVPPVVRQRRPTARPDQHLSPVNERKLWWIDDVANFLGVPKQTIYAWRKKEYGPPAIKVGKHLRWIPATVIGWAKQQERSAG